MKIHKTFKLKDNHDKKEPFFPSKVRLKTVIPFNENLDQTPR